jgi:Bacterial TSP3 repeat
VDTDGDGIGNNRDREDDNDGLSDADEQLLGTDPLRPDTDGEGLTDGFEVANGFDPLLTGEQSADPDGDGLDNLAEQAAGTDPLAPDSDGDGVSDGDEVASGSNPNVAPTPVDWVAVSSDVPVELGGVFVDPGEVAVDNRLGMVVPISLGALPTDVNVTAYHLFPDGDQLFSLDRAAVLDGLAVGPEDVVR